MPDNIYYGGTGSSSMTIFVLAATLLACLLVMALPRKWLLAPVIIAVFLTPFGQQLVFGGAHFSVIRIIAVVAAVRLLLTRLISGKPLFTGGFNRFDKLFFAWMLVRGIAFILLFREGGAVINQVGLWMDAFGAYFLFRHCLEDDNDVLRVSKVLVVVVSVLAACMAFEYVTRINVFSRIAGHTIEPWLRDGRVRAQGAFGNSITAGTIGATLLPLLFWLWKSGKARLWGLVGTASASVIAVTSMASTPITGFLAGILGLFMWPLRRSMRMVRWAVVSMICALALVMKAPVWYIITKINIAGGQSWDRAYLIDQAMRHISDWWLIGTKDNANWGDFTWDQCNQYINEGLQGGVITMVLFIAIISMTFSIVGKCRKQLEGKPEEWYYWCLGATMFAHVITFLGIDYFDQTRILWFLFLAIISGATFPVLAAAPSAVPSPEPAPIHSRGGSPRLAHGRFSPSVSRFTTGNVGTSVPTVPRHGNISSLGAFDPRRPRSFKE